MTLKFTFLKWNIVLQYQTRSNLSSSFEAFLNLNFLPTPSTQRIYRNSVFGDSAIRDHRLLEHIHIYNGKSISVCTLVIKVKLEGYFHFHCCILGFMLIHSLAHNTLFRRLRKTLPDHCSFLRTEVSEQNSPPSSLDLSVCFILPLHGNDTNIKREQKKEQ